MPASYGFGQSKVSFKSRGIVKRLYQYELYSTHHIQELVTIGGDAISQFKALRILLNASKLGRGWQSPRK